MRRRGLALGLALGHLSACGYGWVQRPAHLQQPCIAVLPFVERPPVGISLALAAALQRQLLSEGVTLCPQLEAAPARLDGTVAVLSQASITPRAGGVSAWQVTASLDAELRASDDRLLWRGQVQVREDYLPAALPEVGPAVQPILTENNRRTALLRLADSAAERLHERLMLATRADDA